MISVANDGDGNHDHDIKMIKLIVVMTTVIIIIAKIAFKGANRDFFTSHCAALASSCANQVQHIERLSRATCRVKCHVVRRGSSTIKSDSV